MVRFQPPLPFFVRSRAHNEGCRVEAKKTCRRRRTLSLLASSRHAIQWKINANNSSTSKKQALLDYNLQELKIFPNAICSTAAEEVLAQVRQTRCRQRCRGIGILMFLLCAPVPLCERTCIVSVLVSASPWQTCISPASGILC